MPRVTSDNSIELDSVPGHTAYWSGVAGRVYNEAGFRHFLDIELRRAARSGHCLLLVLVVVRVGSGRSLKLNPVMATRVFAALGATVREVDFAGWFKDGYVAAVALVQRATPSPDIRQRIERRVRRTLDRQPLLGMGMTLRVRVVPLRGKR